MKPLTPASPHVIILVGIPGAGKTAFAEHFAKTFHAPFINTAAIAHEASISIRSAVTVSEILFNELLKTKQTIIYEGPTAKRVQRIALMKHISKAGYTPLLVWVQTESIEARKRATRKQALAPHSYDSFDAALYAFNAPTAAEKPIVMSGKHTYATQVKIVLKHLAQSRPELPQEEQPRVRSGRNIIVR